MIEAHTLDAWTNPSARQAPMFGYAMILGGFGAPLFLFLAGIAVALSAGSKTRAWQDAGRAAQAVRRRGWEIFGLAFLFRLQSYVLNSGQAASSLLKVDILNVMGPAIVAAATLWGILRGPRVRVVGYAIAAVAIAMLTPPIRSSSFLALLPDPIEWYLRPAAGHTNFTLFPWAGFVLAGSLVGVAIDQAFDDRAECRLMAKLTAVGASTALLAYGASFLPPIYRATHFWTSSPTFFFLRCGVVTLGITLAYAWDARPFRRGLSRPLVLLGRSSLFVYWIHVEMVYGMLTKPLHRRLDLAQVVAAFALFTGLMLVAVLGKNWIAQRWGRRTEQTLRTQN